MLVKSRGISESANNPVIADDPCIPPRWIDSLLPQASRRVGQIDGLQFSITEGTDFALTSIRLSDAKVLDATNFERRVVQIYQSIAQQIHHLAATHPVRFWNHIPAIHEQIEPHRDRYMVFNAGRYKALLEWHDGIRSLEREVAAASGVGHSASDLVVHCLSARRPGLAVQNPRQIPPHRYSTRYGPLPPCFARATHLCDRGLLLVGGTASVRGEQSLHLENLPAQFQETVLNLASVVAAASNGSIENQDRWLQMFTHIRVYFPRPSTLSILEQMVRQTFPRLDQVEMCQADLCRPELLVEIEGVATIGA